jgi:hydrogenase-1 operon protein HyaF
VSINEIPVRVVGPGSQPKEEQLRFIDMPGEMARYTPPYVEDLDAVRRLDGAKAAMQWLRQALRSYECGSEPLLANLSALDDESRELVNQVLGEGEVSVTFTDDGVAARTQESVLAGVWRTLYFDGEDRVACDLIEVADAPLAVRARREQDEPVDITPPDAARGVHNALPILVELESQLANYVENGQPHSINLSLLPLSEDEVEFLDARLGRGPVDVLSRAYGKCQVISTRTPGIWWVRYYNAMGTLILNSLEVVAIPQVICAAAEDLRDSAVRLDEILAPYWADIA